jgi:hypothetical protein
MTDNTPAASPLPPLFTETVARDVAHLRKHGMNRTANTIDALLARTLTPEEAEVSSRALRFHDAKFGAEHVDLAAKLGQIAGDR